MTDLPTKIVWGLDIMSLDGTNSHWLTKTRIFRNRWIPGVKWTTSCPSECSRSSRRESSITSSGDSPTRSRSINIIPGSTSPTSMTKPTATPAKARQSILSYTVSGTTPFYLFPSLTLSASINLSVHLSIYISLPPSLPSSLEQILTPYEINAFIKDFLRKQYMSR